MSDSLPWLQDLCAKTGSPLPVIYPRENMAMTSILSDAKVQVGAAAVCSTQYEILTKENVSITAKETTVQPCQKKIKIVGIDLLLPPVMLATLHRELKNQQEAAKATAKAKAGGKKPKAKKAA